MKLKNQVINAANDIDSPVELSVSLPEGALCGFKSTWPPTTWYVTHVERSTTPRLEWWWFVLRIKLSAWGINTRHRR